MFLVLSSTPSGVGRFPGRGRLSSATAIAQSLVSSTRASEQVHAAQALHEGHHLLRQCRRRLRRLAPENPQLAARVRVVHPVVEAAAFDRVVDLARAVRGDDDDRRLGRLQRADFRHRDLPVGEHFQQVGFEGLVGAVQLVDQQHRRSAFLTFERLGERPLDEEFLRENVRREFVLRLFARGFREPDLDHLRVIPLVGRLRDVQALVALQADQLAAERLRHHLGDLGLAGAGFALEEQGALHGEREVQRGGQAAVGDVVGRREHLERVVDGFGLGCGHKKARSRRACSGERLFYFIAASTARLAITVIRCARYSAEACRSEFNPSALTFRFATDSGANLR